MGATVLTSAMQRRRRKTKVVFLLTARVEQKKFKKAEKNKVYGAKTSGLHKVLISAFGLPFLTSVCRINIRGKKINKQR